MEHNDCSIWCCNVAYYPKKNIHIFTFFNFRTNEECFGKQSVKTCVHCLTKTSMQQDTSVFLTVLVCMWVYCAHEWAYLCQCELEFMCECALHICMCVVRLHKFMCILKYPSATACLGFLQIKTSYSGFQRQG